MNISHWTNRCVCV